MADGDSLWVPDKPGLDVQLAVQLVALLLLQLSVELAPALIVAPGVSGAVPYYG